MSYVQGTALSVLMLWNPILGFAMGYLGKSFRMSVMAYLGVWVIVQTVQIGGWIQAIAISPLVLPIVLISLGLGVALNFACWFIGRKLSNRRLVD